MTDSINSIIVDYFWVHKCPTYTGFRCNAYRVSLSCIHTSTHVNIHIEIHTNRAGWPTRSLESSLAVSGCPTYIGFGCNTHKVSLYFTHTSTRTNPYLFKYTHIGLGDRPDQQNRRRLFLGGQVSRISRILSHYIHTSAHSYVYIHLGLGDRLNQQNRRRLFLGGQVPSAP